MTTSLHTSVGGVPCTPPAGGRAVVGIDCGSPSLRVADAAAHRVVAVLSANTVLAGAVVATHLTRLGAAPHVTLSVEVPTLCATEVAELVARALPDAVLHVPDLGLHVPDAGLHVPDAGLHVSDAGARGPAERGDPAAAAAGAAAHLARTGGRAVQYPGVELLVGTLSVARVLAGSAIDAVHVLGGTGAADPDSPVVTRDHVRPAYDGGRLVLAAEWAIGRTLVPFETPTPTPCCVDHA